MALLFSAIQIRVVAGIEGTAIDVPERKSDAIRSVIIRMAMHDFCPRLEFLTRPIAIQIHADGHLGAHTQRRENAESDTCFTQVGKLGANTEVGRRGGPV